VNAKRRLARLLFGLAALISFLLSVYLWFFVDKQQAIFVGLWVPSILSLGAFLQSSPGGEA
jgi:hypothetical protein